MTDRLWTDDEKRLALAALYEGFDAGDTMQAATFRVLDAVLPAIRKRWLTELADEIEREGPWCSGDRTSVDCRTYLMVVDLLRRKAEEA